MLACDEPLGPRRYTVQETKSWADKVQLQVVEEPIIRGVRADPEPSDLVTVQEPEGTSGLREGADTLSEPLP